MDGTRVAAPAGTVTMLFTDIESSSDGVRTLGTDKWEGVLERHTQIIRKALTGHGGFEVRSEGDAFFVVFTSPSEALAAAAEMQRGLSATDWPHHAGVRVRMGIHTGEVRPASVAPRARALLGAVMLAAMQGDPAAVPLAEESVPLLRALGLKLELAYVLMIKVRFALPEIDDARRAMNESRALFEEGGAPWGVGQLLGILADTELRQGNYEAARSRYSESLSLLRQLGELTLSTNALLGLSQLACIDGDYARARALVEEALAIRRQPDFGYQWTVANALIHLGEIDRCEGDPAHGVPYFEQAMATGRELADDVLTSWALHNLGHVAMQAGDLATAGARFRESLLLRWRLQPGQEVAASLAGVAGVASRQGQLTQALRLFGAVDRMLESMHSVLRPADERVRREDLITIRSEMDDPAFDAAFREGQAAKFEDLESMADAVSVSAR